MLEDLQERKRRLEEERNSNDLVEDMPTGFRKSVRSKKTESVQKAPAQEKGIFTLLQKSEMCFIRESLCDFSANDFSIPFVFLFSVLLLHAFI